MTETPAESAEPVEPSDDGKTFDAEYVRNLRSEAAKYRNEAKAGKAALEKLAALEDAQKSELQKANERADAAERAAANAALDRDRMNVALTKGLNPELAPLLSGSTKEEIEAAADLLAKHATATGKPAPKIPTAALKSGATSTDEAAAPTGKGKAAAALRQLAGRSN